MCIRDRPHSIRAVEANAEGKSIFAYDKSGKVATAYEQLGKEVAEIVVSKNTFAFCGRFHRTDKMCIRDSRSTNVTETSCVCVL